jgi:hypothetical protein
MNVWKKICLSEIEDSFASNENKTQYYFNLSRSIRFKTDLDTCAILLNEIKIITRSICFQDKV